MLGAEFDEDLTRRRTGEGFFRPPRSSFMADDSDGGSETGSKPGRVIATAAPAGPTAASDEIGITPQLMLETDDGHQSPIHGDALRRSGDDAMVIALSGSEHQPRAGSGSRANSGSRVNSGSDGGAVPYQYAVDAEEDEDFSRRESLTVPKARWEAPVVVASPTGPGPTALSQPNARTSSIGAGNPAVRAEGSQNHHHQSHQQHHHKSKRDSHFSGTESLENSANPYVPASQQHAGRGGPPLRLANMSLTAPPPTAMSADTVERMHLIAMLRECLERLESRPVAAGGTYVRASDRRDHHAGEMPTPRRSHAPGDHHGASYAFDAVVPAGHRRKKQTRSKSGSCNPGTLGSASPALPAVPAPADHPATPDMPSQATSQEKEIARRRASTTSLPEGTVHGVDQVGGERPPPLKGTNFHGSGYGNFQQPPQPGQGNSPTTVHPTTKRRSRRLSGVNFGGEGSPADDATRRQLQRIESGGSFRRTLSSQSMTAGRNAAPSSTTVAAKMGASFASIAHAHEQNEMDLIEDVVSNSGMGPTPMHKKRSSTKIVASTPHASPAGAPPVDDDAASRGSSAGSLNNTSGSGHRNPSQGGGPGSKKDATKRLGLPDSHKLVQVADVSYVIATFVIYALAIGGLVRQPGTPSALFVAPIGAAYAATVAWTVLRFFVQQRSGAWDIAAQLPDIRSYYLRSWFALDVFCALPLDFVALAWSVDVFLWLQLRHALRVPRLSSLTRSANPLKERRMGILMFILVLVAVFAIHVFSAGFSQIEDDMTYTEGVYWTITTISSVGYGDVVPSTAALNRGYAALVMVFGVMMISAITALATSTITARDALDEAVRAKKAMLSSMLEYYRIPWQEQIEIIGLFPVALDKENEKGFTNLVENLPGFMVGRIERYTRAKALADAIPLFSELPVDVVLDVTSKLQQHFATANEEIISKGDEGNEMFFLVRGVADVIIPVSDTEDLVVASLRSGAFFGEMALLQNTTRTASVVTVVPCELLVLSKSDFQHLVHEHQILEKLFLEVIFARLELTSLTQREDHELRRQAATDCDEDGSSETGTESSDKDNDDNNGNGHRRGELSASNRDDPALVSALVPSPYGLHAEPVNPLALPEEPELAQPAIAHVDSQATSGRSDSGHVAAAHGTAGNTADTRYGAAAAEPSASRPSSFRSIPSGTMQRRPPPQPSQEPDADRPLTWIF
uniref:Cyclic nucleotide-binding domain-containing protein n=1 Tax=Neobodo designis TaxID=312471 RepID=A0A7S1LQR2_NEODS|mmetsp:Transcript_26602/g.82259  ORF Transcript_26602/g.82259 Transcript_26602/m.82259 type:complete len:1196 (+) Transcript_26602:166-3753(+)